MANRINVCLAVWRRPVLLACLTILALNGSLWAAQRSQGRVFTNEDVQTAPPPAPAAAAEPAAPAAAKESGAAASAETAPEIPSDLLKRLLAIQAVLGQAFDDLTAKMQQQPDDAEYSRLTAMRDCLGNLMVDYKAEIEQVQAAAQHAQSAQQTPAQPSQP